MKLKNKIILLSLIILNCISQAQNLSITGTIKNHQNESIYLLKCQSDTLIFIDSVTTNKTGNFSFKINNSNCGIGLYKILLNKSNSFNVINNELPIELKTTIGQDFFNNTATDSLFFINSEENKNLLQFQKLQTELNIASSMLLQILRLFPISDSFHKKIEMEYISRYVALSRFMKSNSKQPNILINKYSNLISSAYYRPVTPDWKATDKTINDTIIHHFFDYFHPSQDFYFHTNILPEKIEEWLNLHSPIDEKAPMDEVLLSSAAADFLKETIDNQKNFNFSLNYFLKKFEKARAYKSFLSTYDQFLLKDNQECDQTLAEFAWARSIASTLRKIEVGNTAPDFEIFNSLKLYDLVSDFTILVFWASWCGHCGIEIPEIQKAINEFKQKNSKTVNVVTISLDKDEVLWKDFLKQKNLSSWLNTSELKGWQGNVPKMYNIYATPTIYLLDKEKKIIATPLNAIEISNLLK
ncbi:MAG: TlpA disulfide reductase family protein [Bacteroidota bacterium]